MAIMERTTNDSKLPASSLTMETMATGNADEVKRVGSFANAATNADNELSNEQWDPVAIEPEDNPEANTLTQYDVLQSSRSQSAPQTTEPLNWINGNPKMNLSDLASTPSAGSTKRSNKVRLSSYKTFNPTGRKPKRSMSGMFFQVLLLLLEWLSRV